jgi:hypothetical protein
MVHLSIAAARNEPTSIPGKQEAKALSKCSESAALEHTKQMSLTWPSLLICQIHGTPPVRKQASHWACRNSARKLLPRLISSNPFSRPIGIKFEAIKMHVLLQITDAASYWSRSRLTDKWQAGVAAAAASILLRNQHNCYPETMIQDAGLRQ